MRQQSEVLSPVHVALDGALLCKFKTSPLFQEFLPALSAVCYVVVQVKYTPVKSACVNKLSL